jgi:hypothetical protein
MVLTIIIALLVAIFFVSACVGWWVSSRVGAWVKETLQ